MPPGRALKVLAHEWSVDVLRELQAEWAGGVNSLRFNRVKENVSGIGRAVSSKTLIRVLRELQGIGAVAVDATNAPREVRYSITPLGRKYLDFADRLAALEPPVPGRR